MTPQELQDMAAFAKQQFYSYPSIIKRHFPPKKHVLPSLGYNLLRRRSTTKK